MPILRIWIDVPADFHPDNFFSFFPSNWSDCVTRSGLTFTKNPWVRMKTFVTNFGLCGWWICMNVGNTQTQAYHIISTTEEIPATCLFSRRALFYVFWRVFEMDKALICGHPTRQPLKPFSPNLNAGGCWQREGEKKQEPFTAQDTKQNHGTEIADHFQIIFLIAADFETRKRAFLCRGSQTDSERMPDMKCRAPGVKFCLIYPLMNSSPILRRPATVCIPKQENISMNLHGN